MVRNYIYWDGGIRYHGDLCGVGLYCLEITGSLCDDLSRLLHVSHTKKLKYFIEITLTNTVTQTNNKLL